MNKETIEKVKIRFHNIIDFQKKLKVIGGKNLKILLSLL